jgi:hypothetical protein
MTDFPTEEEPLDITETRRVKRITMGQVFSSIFDAFNVDRGGIFTLKQLFRNPGKAVREYLGANRYHYTPPFRILVITTAISLFLIVQADSFRGMKTNVTMDVAESAQMEEEKVDITEESFAVLAKLDGFWNLILWTFLPLIAVFSYLFNLKGLFNYAEHLVYQTYMFSLSNILSFIFPLDKFVHGAIIFGLVYLVLFGYYIYGYREFLQKSWLRSVLESVFILIVASILWTTILGIALGVLIAFQINQQ